MELEFRDFSPKACKGRTAIEFMPKKSIKIDLSKAADALRDCSGLRLEAETPRMLLLKCSGLTVSFFTSGKVLVRGTKSKETAFKALKSLLKCIAKV